MELERTDDALVLQNCVCDPDESAEEDRGPLLAAPASAESATLRERIKVSTKKNLTYIRENRRKLAAGVMLWTAFLIATIAFSLLAPFFPQEALDKGASSATIGLIIGAAPGAVIILSPFTGYLLPLVGVHFGILVGLLLIGISYSIMGITTYIPSTWGFIVVCFLLRTIEGVGTALYFTSTFFSLSKLFPNSVNTVMGLFEMGFGLGFCLGRPIGGLLYTAGGFIAPFLTVGPAAILISIPSTLLLQKVKVDRKEEVLPRNVTLSISLDLFFIVVAIGNSFGLLAIAVQTTILEPYLIDEFDLNPFEISWVFFIQSVAFALSNIPAGLISDKIRFGSSVMVGGLLVSASGQFILGIEDYIPVPKLWIVYVGMLITGFGASLATVPAFGNLIRIARRYSNKDEDQAAVSFVAGIVSSALSVGQLLGFVLGGVINDFVSFPMTSFIFGEMILSEGLLLLGVGLVDKFTRT